MTTASPGPATGPRRRAPRADAQRNRDLLVAAAREVFAERGADAPLDEIARRAGIGNATLYRHFPDRRELLIAVYADEVNQLCARGETLLADEPARESLFIWMGEFVRHVASKRDLALAIPGDPAGRRTAQFDDWHQAMRTTAGRLLARAQAVGAARPGLDAADLLVLASGIAVTAADPGQADRCLALLRAGIRGE